MKRSRIYMYCNVFPRLSFQMCATPGGCWRRWKSSTGFTGSTKPSCGRLFWPVRTRRREVLLTDRETWWAVEHHTTQICVLLWEEDCLLDLLLLTVTSSVAICSHLPALWLLFHLPGPLCFSSAVHTDPIFCVSASYSKDNFYLTVDTLGVASMLECLKLCR